MDKELLKTLNYIDYTEEELSELEKASVESKNEYAEKLYWVKNEEKLRKEAFSKLNDIVRGKLRGKETLKYRGIFFNSLLRENVHRYPMSPGIKAPIYLGIFISDFRIFIYKLSPTYYIIEDYEYINEIKNIEYIKNSTEFSKTYGICFNDKREMDIRPFNDENYKLMREIINYLEKEQGILVKEEKIIPYHERLATNDKLIIYGVITVSFLIVVVIGLMNVIKGF